MDYIQQIACRPNLSWVSSAVTFTKFNIARLVFTSFQVPSKSYPCYKWMTLQNSFSWLSNLLAVKPAISSWNILHVHCLQANKIRLLAHILQCHFTNKQPHHWNLKVMKWFITMQRNMHQIWQTNSNARGLKNTHCNLFLILMKLSFLENLMHNPPYHHHGHRLTSVFHIGLCWTSWPDGVARDYTGLQLSVLAFLFFTTIT